MLEHLDLKHKVSKADFKEVRDGLELDLGKLQRQARQFSIPVIVMFEGWGGAGKGTQINKLIQCWDPRGFSVHSIQEPNPDEAMRPFLWRFWHLTPARGHISVFDRSWYHPVLEDRVEGTVKGKDLGRAFADIASFERQLTDAGTLIIKFFLHISRGEQRRRFETLCENDATAWRVGKEDRKQNRKYADHLRAIEDMLARTDCDHARWTPVPAHHERTASLTIFRTVAEALKRRITRAGASQDAATSGPKAGAGTSIPQSSPAERPSPLAAVDLSATMARDEYKSRLDGGQERLRILEHEIYMRRVPVVIVYEGWDAAGKGGNIRRLTREMDPRGYEVVPVAAPNDIERAHHYLWRFWEALPKAGHIAIFDRSWYGRVLVERVEGFCSREEWKRAYEEINEFERHLVNYGTVLVKFWLQIDRDEQLRRFKAREQNPHKKWKITEEDWRNREKWDEYRAAVEEMLLRTSPPSAPWTVVAANSKWHARVTCIEATVKAVEDALG